MISYHFENDFVLQEQDKYTNWIISILQVENNQCGELSYIFCDDDYLGEINLQYLNHCTYTDIITFDYSNGGIITGDIFISTERVDDNSKKFNTAFENELKRVMAHGVLHLMGYDDKTEVEKEVMRAKEDELIKMFHVEQ